MRSGGGRWWGGGRLGSLVLLLLLGLCLGSDLPNYRRSALALDYISKLYIRDPKFYSVFTDDEIYAYFRPVADFGPQVPFYVWDAERLPSLRAFDRCKRELPEGFHFGMGESSWRKFLNESQYRTEDPSAALLHYVDTNFAGALWMKNQCSQRLGNDDFRNITTELQALPEYKRFGGANFFFDSAHWTLPDRTAKAFRRIRLHHWGDYEMAKLVSSMVGLEYTTNAVPYICGIKGTFIPSDKFDELEHYPAGTLESYEYPGGIWAQVKKQRPYNFVFWGRILSNGSTFKARQVMIKRLPGFMEPNAIVEHGSCWVDKECGADTADGPGERSGCCDAHNMNETYASITLKGRLGLHLRGDNFDSARLADLIHSQTIPVVIMRPSFSTSLWNSCFVPWEQVAFIIDEQHFITDPQWALAEVQKALNDDLIMEKKYRMLQYYRGLISVTPNPDHLGHEAQLSTLVQACVDSNILWHANLNRSAFKCPFSETTTRILFPPVGDEDFSPPWGETRVGPFLLDK